MIIFIPFNVPSLKNSKPNGKFHSKTVRQYLQKIGVKSYNARNGVGNYKTRPNIFAMCVSPIVEHLRESEPPYEFGFHFVRDSRRKFDFHNAVQIVADLLTAHRVIPDDNMDYFIPKVLKIDGKNYSIDKIKPGVWVEI